MKSQELFQQLDGIYQFMGHAYNGNWVYRWDKTPYFDTTKNGKTETVPGHVWACIGLWYNLRRVCPKLNSLVNSTELYETLWGHDLGETYKGDISAYLQLGGQGADKHLLEREEIKKMTKNVQSSIRESLLESFDQFESPPDSLDKLEVLMGIFLDSLQGNHFALTFGHNLPDHSETISKIINKYQIPYVRRLFGVVQNTGNQGAVDELREVFDHHIRQIEATGIKLDTSNFNQLLDSKSSKVL